MMALLCLLVIALHIKGINWLTHPGFQPKVVNPLPIEVTLLPAPIKKPDIEQVPSQVVVSKKPLIAKPKAKPKLISKPKPAPVQKPEPVVKQVLPKPIAPITPVIQTPSESPSQSSFKIAQASSPIASTHKNSSNTATSKSSSVATQATDNSSNGGDAVNSGFVVLERVQPKYPLRAINRHIEGYVKVAFTISTSGSAINPVVIKSDPPDIFDDASLQAIQKWKFKQKIVNGRPVEQRVTQTVQFKLPKH